MTGNKVSEDTKIRAIIFREGDLWVAQCLEYDIGAQAADLDTLQSLLSVVLRAECEAGKAKTGKPFGGINPAPSHFFEMWGKRTGLLTPLSPGVENLDMGMAA